jgi:hypothetical protein
MRQDRLQRTFGHPVLQRQQIAGLAIEIGLLAFEVSVLFYSLHPDRELV